MVELMVEGRLLIGYRMNGISFCYIRSINSLFSSKSHCVYSNTFRYSTTKSAAPANYCLDLVRKYDYENFICTLLLPTQIQSLAFAVRAFNIEVARVQDQVSQVDTARMRLAFWLDTVDKIFKNEVKEHPVVIELQRTMNGKSLSKKHLKNLTLARMTPISSTSFRTVEDMEKYAEASVSPVYYIMLECSRLGSIHTDHAASHLGKAQGLTNLIRSIPYSVNNRTLPVPQDLLLKHNVSQEKVLREKCEPQMNEIVYEVASKAKQHLDKARDLRKHCPNSAAAVFLPGVCTGSFLKRLQQADFNIFNEQLLRRNNLLHLQVYWNKLFYRY